MDEPDILLDLRLTLRKLAVRDRALSLGRIMGQGSLPMLGDALGEGERTADDDKKPEFEGVSGLLSWSLSREAVEAEVKQGRF